MIRLKPARLNNLILTEPPTKQEVCILADTEDEILALTKVLTVDGGQVIPQTGSTAATVVDEKVVVYLLLPGGWAKTGG